MPKHINFAYPRVDSTYYHSYYTNKVPQNSNYHACIEALQGEGTRCKVKLDASALRVENIDKLVKNLVDCARKRPTKIKLTGYVRPEYIQAFQQKIQEAPYLPNLTVEGIDILDIQESNRIRDTIGVMAQGVSGDKSNSHINRLDGDSLGQIMSYVLPANEADKRMQHSIEVVTNIYKNRIESLRAPEVSAADCNVSIQQAAM